MMMVLMSALYVTSVLLRSSSSSDGEGSLFLLGAPFVLGAMFYWYMRRRYSNYDKHHDLRRDVDAVVVDLQRHDVKVSSFSRVSNSRIPGENHEDFWRFSPLPNNGTVYSWPSPYIPPAEPDLGLGGSDEPVSGSSEKSPDGPAS